MASTLTDGAELARRCEAVGWTVKRTKMGYKVEAPEGTAGWHQNLNANGSTRAKVMSELRRIGFDKAEAQRKAKAATARQEVLTADARRNEARTQRAAKQKAAITVASGEYAVHEDISWALRPHPHPACRLMVVTPKAAQTMLTLNTHNRRVKRKHVAYLNRAMTDNRFAVTHQGIAFDSQGVLMDGQHRLQAIVRSGTTQTLFVFVGIDPQAFAYIDVHARRTAADVMYLDDDGSLTNSAAVGAAVRLVMRYDHDRENPKNWRSMLYDNDEMLTGYRDTKADPDRRQRFQWAVRESMAVVKYFGGFTGTTVAAVGYLALRGGTPYEDVGRFYYGYKTGEDQSRGSPLLVLRREAERYREMQESHHRPRYEVQFGQLVDAWNAFIEGRSINTLKRSADDPIPLVTAKH